MPDYKDLSSFWDRRTEQPAPGFHALIVGASYYPYLSGGNQLPKDSLRKTASSLKQLSGPAKTAADLALWLISRSESLAEPLRTCRLLVSPSASEPHSLNNITSATWQNIRSALWEWHRDLNEDTGGVGLFYFAGHGIQKDRTTPFLLPSDFLGGDTLLDRALDALEIRNGMARSDDFPNLALRQFYFFDACQTDLPEFRRLRTKAPPIFDIQDDGPDDRIAPIFYATTPGNVALNQADVGTYFGMDLIRCLSNGGAENIDVGGTSKWVVTVEKLAQAMNDLTANAVARAGQEIRRFRPSDLYKPETIIHTLDGTPSVDCTFRFDPDDIRKEPISLFGRPSPHNFEIPLKNPHKFSLPAGFYEFQLPRQSTFYPPEEVQLNIQPPLYDKIFRLKTKP